MKKRSKRGMALASTLIMMTIVMMMCTLMVTVTLYASQVTSLQTQNVEDRVLLDKIGNIFLQNKENLPEARSKIKALLSDESASDTATGRINGAAMTVKITENGSHEVILTVKGTRRNNQLMKIVCEKTTDARTGEVTTTLKSWAYAG